MANTLRYPHEDPGDYKGTIVFKVVDEEAVKEAAQAQIEAGIAKMRASAESSKRVLHELAQNTGYADGQVDPRLSSATSLAVARKQREAFGTVPPKNQVAEATSIASDTNLPTKNSSVCPYISLYLPTAFQLQDAVQFENFDLGLIGAGIEKGLQDGASLGSAAMGGIKKSFEALGDIGAIAGTSLNLNNEAAALIAANVASKAKSIGAPAAGAIRSVTGVQLNPNTRALFKSVPLRSFAFNFTMVPTSAVEAEIVKGIVRHFREELYPTGLDMAGINYGYKFPNRFVIETKYNERTIPGLKFLPAYLTGVSSTYNTQGMGFHSDGNFTSTAITLQFTESKALMKQHIQADY